jgi:hypothetical protein
MKRKTIPNNFVSCDYNVFACNTHRIIFELYDKFECGCSIKIILKNGTYDEMYYQHDDIELFHIKYKMLCKRNRIKPLKVDSYQYIIKY